METFRERVKALAGNKGLSMRALEKKCGISNGLISSLQKPSVETLRKLWDTFPDVNRLWLLTGEGEMFAANEQYSTSPGVPVYSDAKFGCSPSGFMGAIENSKADDHVVVPGLRNDGQTFIVRARGNSMVNRDDPEHSIPDGAYVAIQKSNLSTPQWGEVYALSTDDGCIIKRLYPSERENYVKCVSLNDKEYPCFELHSNEIHDIAIVKAVLTVSIRK